jgi:hypothetical protein
MPVSSHLKVERFKVWKLSVSQLFTMKWLRTVHMY